MLSKSIECTTPRVNRNVNYGLWVMMMCQCRFTGCNKRTSLVGDVESRGGWTCVGKGVYGKSQYFSLIVAVNLKPVKKIKST